MFTEEKLSIRQVFTNERICRLQNETIVFVKRKIIFCKKKLNSFVY